MERRGKVGNGGDRRARKVDSGVGRKGDDKQKVRGLRQTLLEEHSVQANICFYTNIEPQGDTMMDSRNNEGIIRTGYQNVRSVVLGLGLEVATEIDVIATLGANVQGISE